MIFRFLARTRRSKAVAVATILGYIGGLVLPSAPVTQPATDPAIALAGSVGTSTSA